MSINLCTDQLALALAAPGQLISVTRMSHDPTANPQYAAARAIAANSATAEDVYLRKPDLVLAGTFTAPATIRMLQDLGIRVEQFPPETSLADIPVSMRKMGAVLGREAEAEAAIARFEAELATLAHTPDTRPRAALIYVNSYSTGTQTLAGDILTAAGFANVADEAGLTSVGVLSLEELVMLAPDVIITGRNYPGHARAEDNLSHPALRALKNTRLAGELTDRDWMCGTPNVLDAIRKMRALHDDVARK